MKTALERCIDEKADRFIVQDDGVVFLQTYGGENVELIGIDASPYVQVAKPMRFGSQKKANDLVPIVLRADWKLSVQRQDGYAVWTVYSQTLPALAIEPLTGDMNSTTMASAAMKPALRQLRKQRCINANEFLQAIANSGRNFFRNNGSGHDGYLTMNDRGNIVWFHDNYTGKRINVAKVGEWDGFSNGGTLKWLVSAIGKHVLTGSTMRHGYFQPTMDNGFENPWGYNDDILLVRDAGVRLGLISPATQAAK